MCENRVLKGLQIAWHKFDVHQINLLKLCIHTRLYTVINTNTNHNTPHENTIPPWILHYTCNTLKWTLLAKLCPIIIYIQGTTIDQTGPLIPAPNLWMQIIEFTYTNDRYIIQATQTYVYIYINNPLIDKIWAQGWKGNPLIIITSSLRGAIHTNIIEEL